MSTEMSGRQSSMHTCTGIRTRLENRRHIINMIKFDCGGDGDVGV